MSYLDINSEVVNSDGSSVNSGFVIYKINGCTLKDENNRTITKDVVNGNVKFRYILPEYIHAMKYDITVKYVNNNYELSESTKQIEVNKYALEDLKVRDMVVRRFEDLHINMTIKDAFGDVIKTPSIVTIKINNRTQMRCNVTGGHLDVKLSTSKLLNDNYTVSVIYEKNNIYKAARYDFNVEVVNGNVTIKIADINTKTYSNVPLRAEIRDSDGKAVNGGVVCFKINGKTLKDANNETVRISVHDGVANIKYLLPSSIGGARYNVTAVFSNKYYNRAEDNDNLTILKYAIENKTFDPIVIKTHQNATINMTLKDEFGNTIVTETNVTIKINNKTFTKTTIKDGVLNIELDVENLKANNYTIDVIYGENQIYLRGENSIQLNIVNRSVTIDLDTNATHTNGQIPIHATITDDVDGKLVDNGTVTFKINGITQLDENGNAIRFEIKDGIIDATYNLPPTIAARSHNMTLVYSNEGYDRCEETTNYTVIKSDIADLKVSNITTKYGENTTISTIICDEDGKAVSAATKIAVKVDGRTLIHDVVENGVVNITVDTDDLFIGDHKIDIVFGENSFYNEKRVEIPLIIEE